MCSRWVHVCRFVLDDARLPLGAFTYQIYPAQRDKRTFQVPREWYGTHTLHVFMQEHRQMATNAWTRCVSIALDSGTWPYFLLPHDTLHAVAVVFAQSSDNSSADAEELLERWTRV